MSYAGDNVPLGRQKKTVIAEMVITVADADIESHPAIKLLQVCLHIGTILKDEINYVQITMSCRSVIPIRKPQQGHCGSEMNPAAFRFAVEMSGQQCMKFSSNRQNFSVCSIDSGLLCKQVGEMLPQSGVIIILTRRELGDLKRFVLTHNTRLRSRTIKEEPGITSWFIHFLTGSRFSSSLLSISILTAISSRTSAKRGIFRDSSILINSPPCSSLKRKPPMREKSSMPVRKSNDDNRCIGRLSSDAAICSRRKSKVHSHDSHIPFCRE